MKKPLKLKEGKFLEKKKPKKSEGLRKIISSARTKIQDMTNTNPERAVTKTGEKSKGRIEHGGKLTHLMGPSHIKIEGNRREIAGAAKAIAPAALVGAGVGASLADKDSDKKKRTQADRKKSRTGRLTTAQQKKIDNAERKAAFDKAFSKARRAGKSDFMFRGKKYTTDIKTDDPGKVSRVVKKAGGGMMKKKGYAKGGAARKSKPRGVGAALRGYGKALR
jgi:hypothetical protein